MKVNFNELRTAVKLFGFIGDDSAISCVNTALAKELYGDAWRDVSEKVARVTEVRLADSLGVQVTVFPEGVVYKLSDGRTGKISREFCDEFSTEEDLRREAAYEETSNVDYNLAILDTYEKNLGTDTIEVSEDSLCY